MTRLINIICDRCGDEITGKTTEILEDLGWLPVTAGKEEFDLCPDCAEFFDSFIREPSTDD